MQKYESLIIIDKTTNKEEINHIIQNITDMINQNGKVKSVENGGLIEPVPEKKGYGIFIVFYTTFEIATKVELSYKENKKIIYDITVYQKK